MSSVLLFVLLSQVGVQTVPPDQSAIFKLTFPAGSPFGQIGPLFLLVQRRPDGSVTGQNLNSGRPIQGRIAASGFSLNIEDYGTLSVRAQPDDPSRFAATLEGPKGLTPVSVTTAASVWKCGNHSDPAHLAESEEEMRSHSAKNGCLRWSKVQPPK